MHPYLLGNRNHVAPTINVGGKKVQENVQDEEAVYSDIEESNTFVLYIEAGHIGHDEGGVENENDDGSIPQLFQVREVIDDETTQLEHLTPVFWDVQTRTAYSDLKLKILQFKNSDQALLRIGMTH